MTAAWRHAVAKERLERDCCPACDTPLETGYGLAGGGFGPYEYCPSRRCLNPYFSKYPEHEELEEHPIDAAEAAVGLDTMKSGSSSSLPSKEEQ